MAEKRHFIKHIHCHRQIQCAVEVKKQIIKIYMQYHQSWGKSVYKRITTILELNASLVTAIMSLSVERFNLNTFVYLYVLTFLQ